MAFYIDLEKIKETDKYVDYKFYSIEDNEGILRIYKEPGTVELLKKIKGDDAGILFERAVWALYKHWKENKYPETTFWAS